MRGDIYEVWGAVGVMFGVDLAESGEVSVRARANFRAYPEK
jgi:hypothetical protein